MTEKELNKIKEANESVKGTLEYTKYHMWCTSKSKRNNKWTAWNFLGRSIPKRTKYYIKMVKDKMYLISDEYKIFDSIYVERYEVTDEIKKLLEIE